MKSNAVVKVETVHRLRAVDVHATAGGARGDVIERAVTRETTGDGRHVFGGLVLGERFSRGWVEDLDVALHGTAEDAVAGGGPDGAERRTQRPVWLLCLTTAVGLASSSAGLHTRSASS